MPNHLAGSKGTELVVACEGEKKSVKRRRKRGIWKKKVSVV